MFSKSLNFYTFQPKGNCNGATSNTNPPRENDVNKQEDNSRTLRCLWRNYTLLGFGIAIHHNGALDDKTYTSSCHIRENQSA